MRRIAGGANAGHRLEMSLTERLREWTWPVTALLISAAMLAAAHAFERFGGLPPCPLCLKQRDVYWGAIGVAIVGLALWRIRPTPRFALAIHVLLGLVFITGAVVATYHAGGEWGFWPLPASCAGVSGPEAMAVIEGNDLLGKLGTPSKVVGCEEAGWRMLGISMAGYNALVSAGLALFSFICAGVVFSRAGGRSLKA